MSHEVSAAVEEMQCLTATLVGLAGHARAQHARRDVANHGGAHPIEQPLSDFRPRKEPGSPHVTTIGAADAGGRPHASPGCGSTPVA